MRSFNNYFKMESLIPKKRPLPDAYEVLNAEIPHFLKDIDLSKKTSKKPQPKILQKPAELSTKPTYNAAEQYDYFASEPNANLANWKAPKTRSKMSKNDWIRSVDTSRTAALGLS